MNNDDDPETPPVGSALYNIFEMIDAVADSERADLKVPLKDETVHRIFALREAIESLLTACLAEQPGDGS